MGHVGHQKNLTSLFFFFLFFFFDLCVTVTLDCDEHFVCYWRILWKLLSGRLHFFSAFYSEVDGYSEVMNRYLGNLLRSSKGENSRK